MVVKAEGAKILDARKARMSGAVLEPKRSVEPIFSDDGAGEADSGLDHNSSFLGVNGNFAAFSGEISKPIEGLLQCRLFAGEMSAQTKAAAGMGQVGGDESMAAPGATPKRFEPARGPGLLHSRG